MFRAFALLIFFLTFYFPLFAGSGSQNSNDSLMAVIHGPANDTNKVIACYTISRRLRAKGDYDTAMYYAGAGLDLSRRLKYVSGEGHSLYTVGLVHQGKGNNPEAQNCYLLSLRIAEKLGDRLLLGATTNALGIIYWYMGDHETALDYLHRSLMVKKLMKDERGIANTYNNIANVLHDQGKLREAIGNLNVSIRIKQKLKDKLGLSNSFTNRGSCYQNLGIMDSALMDFTAALELRNEYGDKAGIVGSMNNLIQLYSMTGRVRDALGLSGKSLALGKELNSRRIFMECYKAASVAYDSAGLYSEAYGYFKQYLVYKDSILNEENMEKSIQQQMQYDFEMKAAALRAKQERKEVLAQQEHRTRETIILFIASSIGLTLVLSILLLVYLARNRRKNRLIENQKISLEEKQADIVSSIQYARRIQQAQLPAMQYIERSFKRLNKG
ncbi:MAG: tetratricopeptide repeat protein [Bacteroidia bacterium]|nr:tetratricopeptide repeat protein [Bacteroidia bacterium]